MDNQEAPKKNVSYTGVVLDRPSHDSLLALVPEGWDSSKTCHHMTLNMGSWKGDPSLLGQKVTIKVLGFAKDDKVAAVSVDSAGLPTKGPAHVTIATGPGGKPFMAGKLNFAESESPPEMPSELTGTVKEVVEGDYSLSEVNRKSDDLIVERWQKLAGLIK